MRISDWSSDVCSSDLPDIPVFREVRDIVGSDWLYLFRGELDAAGLERMLAWVRTTPRAAEPDLGELDWERISERTMDFFHAVRGGWMHHNAITRMTSGRNRGCEDTVSSHPLGMHTPIQLGNFSPCHLRSESNRVGEG